MKAPFPRPTLLTLALLPLFAYAETNGDAANPAQQQELENISVQGARPVSLN